MLAVVSDLHFQHTASDVVTFVSGGEVHRLIVERNVSADALSLLCAMIHEAAERRAAREVEIVLAGDVFELLRTPLWFHGDPAVRPTSAPGPDAPGNPLRDRVHQVLALIEEECRDCWPVWARFVREGRYVHRDRARQLCAGTQVRVQFVPGNHDRLASAWPSVRARVRQLLCAEGSPEEHFPHVIDLPLGPGGRGYGVRIRHGHEYDAWNFGSPVVNGAALQATEDDYLRPSLGDYLTADVATRLATGFRARYARELRRDDARGAAMRRLYTALTEFDDVRPFSLLLAYLSRQFGKGDEETFETLRPLLRDVVAAASRDPFFRREARRLKLPYAALGAVSRVLESAPLALLRACAELGARLTGHAETLDLGGSAPPAEVARLEPGLSDGRFETVIAGHTHFPDQVPLPEREGPDRDAGRFFVDSGTWRTSVRAGVGGCFGRVRTCTLVLAYDDAERRSSPHGPEGRRFETWTGHLASRGLGPRIDRLGPLPEPDQKLVLLAADVGRVDERRAELRLSIGVDGEGRDLAFDGVRAGESIDLTAVEPLPLFPRLDGELWLHGCEEDLGHPMDPDDLLPWALRPLPRDGGRFRVGEGEVKVTGPVGLRLRYRIELAPSR
ncbi:MAG: hypothetical protein HYZ28_18455 [Myxococcales bacterium]|nr:hypothetical protein [Myxococcales bacterium]